MTVPLRTTRASRDMRKSVDEAKPAASEVDHVRSVACCKSASISRPSSKGASRPERVRTTELTTDNNSTPTCPVEDSDSGIDSQPDISYFAAQSVQPILPGRPKASGPKKYDIDYYAAQSIQPSLPNRPKASGPKEYDPTELDAAMARSYRSDLPLTREEAEGQAWGHIDPRIDWPKTPPRFDPVWYAEKQAEIAARGNRKDPRNYRKVWTDAQKKEAREKGLVHPTYLGTREIPDDPANPGLREFREWVHDCQTGNIKPPTADERVVIEKELEAQGFKRQGPRVPRI